MTLYVRARRSAFTLIELLVAGAIVGVMIALLLAVLPESRAADRLASCIAQMRFIGATTHSYAADYQNQILSFTWTSGSQVQSQYSEIRATWPRDDFEAASLQAVDIIRRRAGLGPLSAPMTFGWTPHVRYTYLVLKEYVDGKLPAKPAACPEDKYRVLWQGDPTGFRNGVFSPYQPSGTGSGWRWPYSSSYEFNVATYSNDRGDTGAAVVRQAGTHHTYSLVGQTGPGALGRRRTAEVAFPGRKSLVHDEVARHFGTRWWYATYPEAMQPILFFDGSVVTQKTAWSNPGGEPQMPASPVTVSYVYEPGRWEAPTGSGLFAPFAWDYLDAGYFRWTRMGLRGVDFPGGPVAWTPGVRVKTEVYP